MYPTIKKQIIKDGRTTNERVGKWRSAVSNEREI